VDMLPGMRPAFYLDALLAPWPTGARVDAGGAIVVANAAAATSPRSATGIGAGHAG